MSAEPTDSDQEAILDKGVRSLRDLGNNQPGISFSRDAMRDLGLLDDQTGVEPDQSVSVAVYDDGLVVIDLFPGE